MLSIRSEPSLQSPAIATVKHGERLSILGRRRRVFRVRTPNGAEGWIDDRQLLSTEEMADLRELAKRAASMPSQGQATAFDKVNIHTRPVRVSPSFLQMKEGERVDVLAHTSAPRTAPERKPLIEPAATKKKAAPKKPKKEPKIPPLPMPKPPPPPANWLELSKTDLEEEEEPQAPQQAPPAKPAPTDNWSLVRVPSGESGWVLTRMLTMAIPDEVAQYAEGRRIVSYFSLGSVMDGGEKKHTWLWTTVGGQQPYDFDSFRVFVWGLRRHRYETAYIERNLRGYSPVLVHDVEFANGKYPGFSICVEQKDGSRVRREFAVLGNIVRAAGDRPCNAPASPLTALPANQPAGMAAETPAPDPSPATLAERIKRRVKGWFGK